MVACGMRRRDLLGALGGLAGCATHRGPDLAVHTEADIGPLLATVRARVRQLRGRVGSPELRAFFRERGHPSDLVEQNAGALYISSTFRDLPRELQRHPVVQHWIGEEAPRLARAVLGMATFLDELTEPERATLGAAMKGRGDLSGDAIATALAWCQPHDLEPAREAQLSGALRIGRVSMKRHGPSRVIDDHLDQLDRLAARHGVTWRDWEQVLGVESTAPGVESHGPGPSEPTVAHPLIGLGLAILGIAGAAALLGAGLLGLVSAMGLEGVVVVTLAGGLFAVGIVLGVVGIIMLVLGLVLPRPRASSMKSFGQEVPELTLRESSPPAYPDVARAEGLGAVECLADVLVDKRGRPMAVQIDPACPPALQDAARQAVLGWRWEPARARGDGGRRVHARTSVPVRFRP